LRHQHRQDLVGRQDQLIHQLRSIHLHLLGLEGLQVR
jgi:hypothetical protein